MQPKFVVLQLLLILLILCSEALKAAPDNSQTMQKSVLPEPETQIVDKWRGTWDVKAFQNQPLPAQEVTYTETFDWVLDGRYLRSETSRKSNGGKSMSMFWYDNKFTKNFRFVIYDASGLTPVMPPPTWDENTQTMRWKSSIFEPLSFEGYSTFTDRDTIRWKFLWKDWKGKVLMDIEGTSFRRK